MKSHLGIYSDWVEAAQKQAALYPLAAPGEETRRQIRNMLGSGDAAPIEEHAKIETYERTGYPSRYVGRFYDGPHKFGKAMQKEAFAWLSQTL